MTDQRSPDDGGFTLVEALVSVLVFGLLATGCVAMLATSVQTRGRLSGAEENLRRLEVARALLSSDMAQLLPPAIGSGSQTNFTGQGAGVVADRRLAFTRGAGSPDAGATSILQVEYLIDGRRRLLRRTRAQGEGAETLQERVLFPDASNVRFQFNDGLRWRDDWSAGILAAPAAVAILVDLPRYGEVRFSAYAGSS